MSKITMIHEDGFGGTTTISQESEGGDMVQDHIETFLKFYDACGFVNSLDVVVHNTFLGNSVITWDKENYIQPMDWEEYLELALEDIEEDCEGCDEEYFIRHGIKQSVPFTDFLNSHVEEHSAGDVKWTTTHYYFGFPYEVES